MRRFLFQILPTLIWIFGLLSAPGYSEKDFLTEKEIEAIREDQEIHLRVKRYMEFAELRLKAAEDRLNGIESVEGDPLEFFTPEEMVDGYYRILRSVMMNMDDAYQSPDPRAQPKFRRALNTLKSSTERSLKQLDILKRIAKIPTLHPKNPKPASMVRLTDFSVDKIRPRISRIFTNQCQGCSQFRQRIHKEIYDAVH
jgi:hypothetical protein